VISHDKFTDCWGVSNRSNRHAEYMVDRHKSTDCMGASVRGNRDAVGMGSGLTRL
jgi:hypothetical protein